MLRAGWISWYQEDEDIVEQFNLEGTGVDQQVVTEALLLGTGPEREPFHSSTHVKVPKELMKVIWESHNTDTPRGEDEPTEGRQTPTLPAKRSRPTMKEAMDIDWTQPMEDRLMDQAIQEALEIDWTLPMEERAIKADHLPTLLKGLSADRTKWTHGDWERIRMINKRKRESITYSSQEKKQTAKTQRKNPKLHHYGSR